VAEPESRGRQRGGADDAPIDDQAGHLQVDQVAGEAAVGPAGEHGVLEAQVPVVVVWWWG
jgi:hypothetical protein